MFDEDLCQDNYVESEYGMIHIDDISYFQEEYNSILLKLKKLIQELKLNNVLDVSSLFVVLLLKGYLSANKTFRIDSKDRFFADNFHALDIIRGNGVCLDCSEMHTDLLNKCGYKAAMFACTSNKLIKTRLFTNWYSDIVNYEGKYNILKKGLARIFLNTGGHVVTLIKEDEKFYLYDSINQDIMKINDIKTSIALSINLFYANEVEDSYFFAKTIENKKILDCLKTQTKFLCPYSYEQFVKKHNAICKYIQDNLNIIEDYYTDTVSNINNINDKIIKIKSK